MKKWMRALTGAALVALIAGAVMGLSAPVAEARQKIIAIDAGHQTHGNSTLEPIGPGSSKRKPKVSSGTRGVATRIPEYKLNLAVAKKLRKELEKRGYKVVMIRTTNNVNISNSRRSRIANNAGADLVVRIHANGASSRKTYGMMTLVPARNHWTKTFYKRSLRAGKLVQRACVKETGAKGYGIKRRGDMTGFNWSKVPTVLVEMGFMSNPTEDRKMATDSYRTKLARGMANGVDAYFK